MTVEVSWHLVLMIVVTLLFVFWIFRQFEDSGDWGILTAFPTFLFLIVLWAIYGGIVWW